MPVLVPIVAAGAAYFGGAAVTGAAIGAGMVAAGSIGAAVVGAVAGAVVGAAVGAIGTAITGGDIGKGALYGAVGGAVAGGFAGYGAAGGAGSGSSTGSSSSITIGDLTVKEGGFAGGKGLTGSQTTNVGIDGLKELGKANMYGSLIGTAGEMAQGYATGEAQAEMNKETLQAQKEAQQALFDQRIKEIQESHKARMAEIAASGGGLAVAKENNAAAMEQLKARIAADREAVAAKEKREDDKLAGFNESIRGTDENLFNRPTFDFNPANDPTAFDSGFDQAVAAKQLTPEELEILKQQAKA